MKNVKRKIAACLAVLMLPSLTACQPEFKENFDSRPPWIDGGADSVVASHERLVYSVEVFDTSKGAAEERVSIATGSLELNLSEKNDRKLTDLSSRFSVTYNDSAHEKDRGLTDVITSETTFQTNSLFTSTMKKTVALAPRLDTLDLSYTVEADYFDKHVAKKYPPNKPKEAAEMTIPAYGTYHDNEMLFYLARAASFAPGGSQAFRMTNIYDSFLYGEFTNYTMTASCSDAIVTVFPGEWVKDFGVAAVTAESGEVTYPVSCYNVSIGINADKHGPPYTVQYTEKPFVTGSDETDDKKEHFKIPLYISYPEYTGSTMTRLTEYKLTTFEF